MRIVDLNVLLYAVNTDSAHHTRVLAWWEAAIADDEPIGLAWIVLLGFLRVSTNPRVFPRPLDPDTAMSMLARIFNLDMINRNIDLGGAGTSWSLPSTRKRT